MFLHEGLGCIEMWRDFPQRLCDATRCRGIVYDRTGYGGSSRWPADPGVRYMEIEADDVLPRLLAKLGVEDCVLVGHSDGGTIALNYAASRSRAAARRRDAGRARHQRADLRQSHPARPRSLRRRAICVSACRNITATMSTAAFHLWSDAWVAPGFEPMDADGRLPGIVVPVQAIQGEDDEYGSELQLGIIAGKVGGYCETRLVPDCGHSPHLQQPAYVLSEITRFVAPLALSVILSAATRSHAVASGD